MQKTTVKDLGKVKVQGLEKGSNAILTGDFGKQMKPSSNGEYSLVRITDNTGTAFARVWGNLPIAPAVAELQDGDYVEVQVHCTNVGQYTNIEIMNITKMERPIIRVVEIEALKAELREVFVSYKDKKLYELVKNVFNRPDVKDAFFLAPATQQTGYSFDGGLLAHTVRTIRLSKAVAQTLAGWNHNTDNFVSKLNEDLLTTACILHDVGKVKAFVKNGHRVEKTMDGELFEDSYLSMKIVLEELAKVDLPEYQQLVLEHVLGSSKGKQGYGALFIPRSKEAVAFHLIESLDVQMANFEHLDRNAGAEQSFVQMFQKVMFLGSYDED